MCTIENTWNLLFSKIVKSINSLIVDVQNLEFKHAQLVTKHQSYCFCNDVISNFTIHYKANFRFHQRTKHVRLSSAILCKHNTFWNRIIRYILKRKCLRKTSLNIHLVSNGPFVVFTSWIIINRLTAHPNNSC